MDRDAWGFWLCAAGLLALAVSIALILARSIAFESLLKTTARLASPDGIVTAGGRSRLSTFLVGASIGAAMTGVLLVALANRSFRAVLDGAVRWDPLELRGLKPPNAYGVLIASVGIGLSIVALWIFRDRFGEVGAFLLAKEGPLEHVTFLLELAAAYLCAAAARRWRTIEPHAPAIPALYALCAVGLFLVAMEEINWGQTLLGFETPASWAAINYQQETSVHNLLDRDALTSSTKVIAAVFGIGVLIAIVWSAYAPRSVISAIAPHASLMPLALMIASGGVYLHAEIIELLLALFFVFYSARVYMALTDGGRRFFARPALREVVAGSRFEGDAPITGRSTSEAPGSAPDIGKGRPPVWNTERLEYTKRRSAS